MGPYDLHGTPKMPSILLLAAQISNMIRVKTTNRKYYIRVVKIY